jgi:hypothetical protein
MAVLLALPVAALRVKWWRINTGMVTVVVYLYTGWLGLLTATAVVLVVLLIVRWCWLSGWVALAGRVIGGWRHAMWYSRWWRRVVEPCKLTMKRGADGVIVVPTVSRVLATAGGDLLAVRLLAGQTPEVYEKQAEAIAHAWGVHAVRVDSLKRGWVRLRVLRRDSLTTPIVLKTVPEAHDLRAVPYAVGEDGQWRTRSYANVSGEVGGGVPGSGKTSGETALACALIQNPCVQYVVIDGKASQDWEWITPRACAYLAEDQDFAAVLTVVDGVHDLMRHRLARQKTLRGESNFWNLPLQPAHPVVFLVVDEVQTFTDTTGMPKTQREIAITIKARLASLVKKGRSAGIITKLLTQKPTDDAIPTRIRDNTSIRTCWRVMTREAAEAVLGDTLTPTSITPVDIPITMPGVAVIAGEREAQLERVRYPHITEADAETIAHYTAHLRRPLDHPALTPYGAEGDAA